MGYTIVGNVCVKEWGEGEEPGHEDERHEDEPARTADSCKQLNKTLQQVHKKFGVDNRFGDDMHQVYCNRIDATITQGSSLTSKTYETGNLANDFTEDIRHIFCNCINVSTMSPVDVTLDLQSDEEARGTQSVEYSNDMSSYAVTNIFAQHADDDELDSSQDDQLFLNMMNEGARVTKDGHVEMPLPLKPGVLLSDNRFSVL